MGHKAIETTRNINNAFGSRTANKHTVQWFFKKFCKGDKRLEDKEHSGRASKVDKGQLRAVVEADPLMTTETAEDSMSTILQSFGISSKLERWKSLIRGYLMSWLKIFKNCHFEVSSLILCNNSEPFLNWIVMCDEKWILYQIGDDQLSGWAKKSSKALPQTKLVPKKGHGHCLVVFRPVWSFWILAKPLHLRSRLSKLVRCTKNCKASSQHWSAEWAQFFSMTASYHTLHQQHFKSWTNWTMKFCPTCPLTNQPRLLQASRQLFAGRTLPQPVGDRKCLPRVHEFWRKGFYATGVNKLISHWQKCVDWNGSYFVNKDVFEPSFNDLKFTALNRDCFCINLI